MTNEGQKDGGVGAVRDALDAMKSGGTFEDVLAAVKAATFTIPPVISSLKELGENWDYQPEQDSFRDTVESAFWSGIITKEQMSELRSSATFSAKHPSSQAE